MTVKKNHDTPITDSLSVISLILEVDFNAVTLLVDVRHIEMKLLWRLVKVCYM